MFDSRKNSCLKRLQSALCAVLSLAVFLCFASEAGAATTIKKVRYSVWSGGTRLIFDAEGDRPRKLSVDPENDKFLITFSSLDGMPRIKTFGPQALISQLTYRKAGKAARGMTGRQIEAVVAYRVPGLKESHRILKSDEPGRYKLVVAFRAPPPPPPPPPKPMDFAEASEQDLKLFEKADAAFVQNQDHLSQAAQQIMDLYSEALKAAPKCRLAPQAYYRLGLTQLAAGNTAKALRSFDQVTSNWPDHPLCAQCWLEVGNAASKKQSHLEAVEAYRAALRSAPAGATKAQASLGMGKTLMAVGANKEALEILTQCAAQDPVAAMKNADLVRALGEICFAMKQYEKSSEYFLRWLNLQNSEHDKDLVLAKITEICLIQGNWSLANSIYSYIRKTYPDSDGENICKIRKAEILEKNQDGMEEAEMVYSELSQKKLAPALRRIVNVKMASLLHKGGNLEKSLEMLNLILEAEPESAGRDEIVALREDVVGDLAASCAARKDYAMLVQLHQNYTGAFKKEQPPEVLEAIGEAYNSFGLPGSALDLYEALAAKKKSDDAFFKCAFYALEAGRFEKAASWCAQIQAPEFDVRKAAVLGRVNFHDGKFADAAKYLAKVFQQSPKRAAADPNLAECYARSLIESRRFDEALAVVQQALQNTAQDNGPQRYCFLTLAGRCQAELKQYQSAVESLEAAVQCCSGDQANGVIYEISKVYVASGQQDKALQTLTRLTGLPQGFWKAAGQEQVNSIQMVSSGK
jgi:tetratricopeptide (TPR) repeat protein